MLDRIDAGAKFKPGPERRSRQDRDTEAVRGGIGMLVLGILFLVWRALNPTVVVKPDEDGIADGTRRARH